MVELDADKRTERERYNARARQSLSAQLQLGSDNISAAFLAPYHAYEAAISDHVSKGDAVLELGAGQGEHSLIILRQGAMLTALDISEASLASLTVAASDYKAQLKTLIGDMETPDVPEASLDVVTSAGAISYADKEQLIHSLGRILRAGGLFIAVDSWNHNPIYRFNRWRHYRRGERSKMTLINMPDAKTIRLLKQKFDVELRYFGCLSFLTPLLVRFMSEHQINKFMEFSDKLLPGRYLAFKILIIARKK